MIAQVTAILGTVVCLLSNVRLSQQATRIAQCYEPLDYGGCAMSVMRFWYDPKLNACRMFLYHGCAGNNNRFDDKTQCISICQANDDGSPSGTQNFPSSSSSSGTSACSLDPDPGTCVQVNLVQYYYDYADALCKPFIYNGCGGNGNRFSNSTACVSTCGGYSGTSGTTRRTTTTAGTSAPDYTDAGTTTAEPTAEPTTTTNGPTTTSPPLCNSPNQLMPLTTFEYRSSFFHVFPQIIIPCSGVVRSWTFVPRISSVNGLYLGAFRARTPNAVNTSYTLVGSNAITNYPVTKNVWVTYYVPVSQQFRVQAGDVVGFYYENWSITDDFSVVALADEHSPDYKTLYGGPTTMAYVQQIGRPEVDSQMGSLGYVDTTKANREFRWPALRATIASPVQVTQSTRTTLPQTTGTGTGTPEPAPTTEPTQTTFDPNAGRSPACQDDFQRSQACLDTALSGGKADTTKFKAKWFFDTSKNWCAYFWYVDGCYRSTNLFDTEADCRNNCWGFMARTAAASNY